ncbi:MAG: methyltransferase domain-containing protein [Ktedonobacteraceae bacterium]|nr:methyltransferase domain-containing protein [Ktedonobacteraceae bacterium]
MFCADLLACPICNAVLEQDNSSLKCSNAHSFDISSEGYVNLLRKKLPGDAKEMLIARRDFLEQGHYQPLSDLINDLVYTHLPVSSSPPAILDAGCGEGYYIGRLQQSLLAQNHQANYIGLDVSKDAVRMAARRYKQVCFVVANIKERLIFVDEAMQMMLNIFAPRNPAEFARVLAPGALLLIIIPGSDHLLQLRSALHLLNIEEDKEQKVIAQFAPFFDFVTSSSLSYPLQFNHKEIVQAVMMTPNYWHLSPEVHAMVEKMEALETTVSFSGLVFRRRDPLAASV